MKQLLSGLPPRAFALAFLAISPFLIFGVLALLFVALGTAARAWHWMLAGF